MKYSPFRLSLLSAAAALLTSGYLPINAAGESNYQTTDVSAIRSAAEAGDAEAQSKLGFLLTEGKSVTRNYSEAIVWLRKAADQGSMSGQYNLACAYLNGSGVKEDSTEALRWFVKAAEQGSPHAEFQIGLIYEDEGNFREAAKWYLRAAEKGNTDAQVMLGGLYVDGKGVAKSYSDAEKWFVKASRDGDESATVQWGMLYLDGEGKYNNSSYGMTIIRQAASKGNSLAQQFLADQGPSSSNVGNNDTIQDAPKTRTVSKSERSKINQAIFRSGLSRSLYAARQLSDEEALRLYPDALQILAAKESNRR